MNNLFNAVWTALTTTNEDLINILAIPCSFIEITVTMLLFTTILKIDTTKKQIIVYVICLSLIGILTNLLIPAPFNVFINLFSLPILVLFIFKTKLLKAIIAQIIPIIIGFIIETIFSNMYFLLFNASNENTITIPLFRLSFALINYSSVFILYKICKSHNINITILDSMDKKSKLLLFINSCFMLLSIALQTFLVSFYLDNLPIYISLISIAVLVGYYITNLYSIIKTTKLQLTEEVLEQTKQYNKTLSILYDNIRCFKHDYTNMITTLGGYIQSKDLDGLEKYYIQILDDFSRVNNLSILSPEAINNPAIYSLLTNKYYISTELGISMNIEVFIDFNKINMKIYEFTKILGILLDNAIEASKDCKTKIINIRICNDFKNNRQLLIVENSYSNKDVDTEKIYEKGFSSKPNNTGLGLWETRQILKRNNNLNLFTSKDKSFFKQQLEIYC